MKFIQVVFARSEKFRLESHKSMAKATEKAVAKVVEDSNQSAELTAVCQAL